MYYNNFVAFLYVLQLVKLSARYAIIKSLLCWCVDKKQPTPPVHYLVPAPNASEDYTAKGAAAAAAVRTCRRIAFIVRP